jgi:hypothetical protein
MRLLQFKTVSACSLTAGVSALSPALIITGERPPVYARQGVEMATCAAIDKAALFGYSGVRNNPATGVGLPARGGLGSSGLVRCCSAK